MKIKKRGELTTNQIVMLIILITSFAVILFLLFRLNFGVMADKEICRNSVILKSKGKGLIGDLDCKTGYLCISGGEKCEDFNPTTTIKIDLIQSTEQEDIEKNKNSIMKVIADEMTDCWWMFGEGKLPYSGSFVSTAVHCSICSIIKFDDKIQENIPEITYAEFYNYSTKTKKDETQTYLMYLYNINDLDSFNIQSQFDIDIDNDVILTNKKYSVITGIDNNLGEDEHLKTHLIPVKEISTKTECREFITRA